MRFPPESDFPERPSGPALAELKHLGLAAPFSERGGGALKASSRPVAWVSYKEDGGILPIQVEPDLWPVPGPLVKPPQVGNFCLACPTEDSPTSQVSARQPESQARRHPVCLETGPQGSSAPCVPTPAWQTPRKREGGVAWEGHRLSFSFPPGSACYPEPRGDPQVWGACQLWLEGRQAGSFMRA